MIKRRVILREATLALALAFVIWFAALGSSEAGGWTVTTLDNLPSNVVVNQPLTVGFMIRQHGRTPWVSSDVRVRASPAQGGAELEVRAEPDKTPGHYTATFTFPQAGAWHWAVASGLYPDWQPMPDLQVQSAPSVTNNPAPASAPSWAIPVSPLFLAGILGLIVSSAGLLTWSRRRPSFA